jgi:hypothetical protein
MWEFDVHVCEFETCTQQPCRANRDATQLYRVLTGNVHPEPGNSHLKIMDVLGQLFGLH